MHASLFSVDLSVSLLFSFCFSVSINPPTSTFLCHHDTHTIKLPHNLAEKERSLWIIITTLLLLSLFHLLPSQSIYERTPSRDIDYGVETQAPIRYSFSSFSQKLSFSTLLIIVYVVSNYLNSQKTFFLLSHTTQHLCHPYLSDPFPPLNHTKKNYHHHYLQHNNIWHYITRNNNNNTGYWWCISWSFQVDEERGCTIRTILPLLFEWWKGRCCQWCQRWSYRGCDHQAYTIIEIEIEIERRTAQYSTHKIRITRTTRLK